MNFIWEQLQQFSMVAIIMMCAIGGTVGILKLIKKISPNGNFPKDPISKKLDKAKQNKK